MKKGDAIFTQMKNKQYIRDIWRLILERIAFVFKHKGKALSIMLHLNRDDFEPNTLYSHTTYFSVDEEESDVGFRMYGNKTKRIKPLKKD